MSTPDSNDPDHRQDQHREHSHTDPHDHSHPHDHHPSHGHEPGPLADASVRLAKVADAPAVGIVQSVIMRSSYAGELAPEVLAQIEPAALASVWRRSLSEPPSRDHRLLVACAGAQVVGLAAVGPSADPDASDTTAELLVLGVHPDARRQGHGSRLINAVVDTARGAGIDELTAWLLESDVPTRAFLASAGLEADGAARERVVSPDGDTLREVRVSAFLTEP